MDMDNIDPKLLKIVALAKHGIGGEKDSAIAIVRRMCETQGLDFDEIMSDHDQPKEYNPEIKVRSKDELRVCIQVAAKFAVTPEHPDVSGRYFSYDRTVMLWYTTKASTHIDTLNAISVYLTAYRKEKKKVMRSFNMGFVSHHNLYTQFTEPGDDEPQEQTLEERQDAFRAAQLSMLMTEKVDITKEIGDGKN